MSHYFDTFEGNDAFRDMLTNGTINLNPNNASRLKALREEDVTGKPKELGQVEMN